MEFGVETINRLKLLSLTHFDQLLHQKKLICLLINGFSESEMDIKHRWERNLLSGEKELTMKEQYFHSAASIYILLKYPHLQQENSFINLMETKEIKDLFFIFATHILLNDSDGVKFMRDFDIVMSNSSMELTAIDDKNQKQTIVKKESL